MFVSTPAESPKPAKGQTTCFKCRKIVALKDVQWVDWSAMQVRLCVACEKQTVGSPERSYRASRG